MTHRARRRAPLAVAVGASVLLALAACTSDDGADDGAGDDAGDGTDRPTASSAGTPSTSGPAPVQDVCALLDDAAVDQLVPDGSREFVAQESFEEADGTCTVDNNLPTTQNQVLVVRVTTWPTFDDATMLGALEDLCGDVAATVTDAVTEGATCVGTDGDAGQAHALDGTTIVSVEYQNRFGAGVPDAALSTLLSVAAEVLAAV